VALQYLESWLAGVGAAAIYNLMEDAATAEISRSLLWLWRVRGTTLADGRRVTEAFYREVRDAELERLGGGAHGRLRDAAAVLDALVLAEDLDDFLTLRAYPYLEQDDR
jgi:malate synthase